MMRPKTGQALLEHEIREDQAATMGRMSRELRSALELECSGFRTVDRLLEEYAVPQEVRVTMGAIRPR